MTINYGFHSTSEIEYDKQGLPVGLYKAMAVGEEQTENGFYVEYEVLDGEHKGKRGRVWYNTLHQNPTTANIAKQAVKRIADATGRDVTMEAPIKGRVMTLEVVVQKKDDRYTEVKRYHPERHKPAEDVPFA